MILIGQFDSPFTRRIGITLRLYDIAFEHWPWSVFGDAEKLAPINPLIRVPTLILDSGEALVETSHIIDYLDSLVTIDKRLLPQVQPARYRALNVVAMAAGVSDMAVRMFYELRLHAVASPDYVARMTRQLQGALGWLDAHCATADLQITQDSIAVVCCWRHVSESHPQIAAAGHYPRLETFCKHFERQQVFVDISQPFIAPTSSTT